MGTHNIVPWFVDWDQVFVELDQGGPASTRLAESILGQHYVNGAMAVRAITAHSDWLLPIYKRMGIKVLVGLVFESLFKKFPGPEAHTRWLQYATDNIETLRPDMIYIDRETRTKEFPDTVNEVRLIVYKTMGRSIPIFVGMGKRAFGELTGSYPCPWFFYIWDDMWWPNETPVGRIHKYREQYPGLYEFRGGYPYFCPFLSARVPFLTFCAMGDWIDAMVEVRRMGAVGMSMYPSAFGYAKELGGFDDPRHAKLLEYMRAANEVFAS